MKNYLYEDLYLTEDRHWWHLSKRRIVEYYLKKLLKDKTDANMLDVGCGTGKNLELLSSYGTAWGVDISSDALLYCRKRGLKRIKKANVTALPFKDNSFDIITALDILEHVDDRRALQEL